MSPDGKIMLTVSQDSAGRLYYAVEHTGMSVIAENRLGLERKDADFTLGLNIVSVSEVSEIYDSYKLLHGKKSQADYMANKKVFTVENAEGKVMEIVFQVSDDGFAFKYVFPEESNEMHYITNELSSLQFDENTLAWIQPIAKAKSGWNSSNPSYEESYFNGVVLDSLPDHEPGWIYPALFKHYNYWISITETFPEENYCGTRLMLNKGDHSFKIGFPEQVESFNEGPVYPESILPWETPWRVVNVADNLGSLVESTQGTDLAKASVLEEESFIVPGRSSWSWVLYKDDSTIYQVEKRFIDYASDMGWEYCLVDCDWDQNIGYEKLGELCDYAKVKNVGIIAWYNSAGTQNTTPYTPRDKMLTHESRTKEFEALKKLGVVGVKVDFFGADGQSMMKYYIDILKDAATYGIVVNCHGSTLPRGLQRTYPNLVSMEAIKGLEFVTFAQENADLQPEHSTIIPFTRNLFDPMDFTPVAFSEIPNIKRKTSNAFELATAVLFMSGIQHYGEVPEGMAKVPSEVKQMMKDIPVSWDETKFIDGYPGDFVVIARRKADVWYVAGINGKSAAKSLEINLSFIENPKELTFITDGENNRTFRIEKDKVDFAQVFKLNVIPDGGFLFQVKTGN